MKTKQIQKASVTETAVVAVTVPTDVKAAISACFKADEKVNLLVKEQQQTWVKAGEVLAKHYADKDEARPVLKQCFIDAGKDPKNLTVAGYISNILTLGFPENPKVLEQAKADGLNTQKLLKAARGSIKKSAKEGWIDVEKKGGSGGHNAKKPAETLAVNLANAMTAANMAKLDEEQVAVALVSALADTKFSLTDLIAALEEQADKD